MQLDDIQAVVARVLEAVPVTVVLTPGSGTNVLADWWSIELEELDVEVVEFGLDAAEAAFLAATRGAIVKLIDDDGLSAGEAAVVARLAPAWRMGNLDDLLRASQVTRTDEDGHHEQG